MTVVISEESPRGCGYRKPDKTGVGIYLVAPGAGQQCARLPLALHHCPVCSEGIRPTRGWKWIEPQKLFAGAEECPLEHPFLGLLPARGKARLMDCQTCFAGRAMPAGRHGLLWIGEGFYPKPEDFLREAARMGISRKLPAIPKGFKLGETVVFLAHRYAVDPAPGETERRPGIFSIFRPAGVDLVIDDETSVPERATKLATEIGTGARIVKVVRKEASAA